MSVRSGAGDSIVGPRFFDDPRGVEYEIVGLAASQRFLSRLPKRMSGAGLHACAARHTGGDACAARTENGGRTYFLYDGDNPVVELSSTGNVAAVNTFGPNGLLSRHSTAGSVFYQFDPHGSVAERLGANQNVPMPLVFDAHGAPLVGGSPEDVGYGFGTLLQACGSTPPPVPLLDGVFRA
ncbi:MAG TPA: hypothetical protein VFJ58_03375 [Armatimonadota bacterium]|nr:hypothetical protein [Armatimonadota bacterium]